MRRRALDDVLAFGFATLVCLFAGGAAAQFAGARPAHPAWVTATASPALRLLTPASFPPPAGASVDRPGNRILLGPGRSRLTLLAGPADAMMSFRIAGLTNPAIELPLGSSVVLTVINVDDDMSHNFALSSHAPPFPVQPALAGVLATPVLPSPARGVFHAAVLTLRAVRPGAGFYLCAIAGHARAGMFGKFIVVASSSRKAP